jgi:hypothetical protein
MNNEEYEDHMAMIERCHALLDDWATLKELGPFAEKYC